MDAARTVAAAQPQVAELAALPERSTPSRAGWDAVLIDRRLGRWVFAVTVLAFTILVSVAATHLHLRADLDESCAICVAFGVGKLDVPTPAIVAPVPAGFTSFAPQPPIPPSLTQNTAVIVLPPSCGPPRIA